MKRSYHAWCSVVATVWLTFSSPAWAGSAIKGLRSAHYPEENRTRIVFDCSSRPVYSVSTRTSFVVVTILGGSIETEKDHQTPGLATRVRLETVQGGAAALILLSGPAQVNHFCEPPNSIFPCHRIVLDLRARKPSQVNPENRKCVVLDPGHGGWNDGARGKGSYASLVEKDIVLDIARRLQKLLQQHDRTDSTEVFLTRSTDALPFISNGRTNQAPPLNSQLTYRRKDLSGRVRFAEQRAAMFGRENTVFISLHVNWAQTSKAHGFEVFIANDEAVARGERRELEERENAGLSPPVIDPRVSRYIRNQAQETSTLLARSILKELGKLDAMTPHGENGGLHHANFIVLQTLDCPAVLAELAFVSNTSEARRLASEFHREELARSLYNAIVHYFKTRDLAFSLPVISAPRQREYAVKAGDTLSSIASRFSTTYRSIMRLNGLKSATIYPGQVLRIPG